jgi:hypothetical protein
VVAKQSRLKLESVEVDEPRRVTCEARRGKCGSVGEGGPPQDLRRLFCWRSNRSCSASARSSMESNVGLFGSESPGKRKYFSGSSSCVVRVGSLILFVLGAKGSQGSQGAQGAQVARGADVAQDGKDGNRDCW